MIERIMDTPEENGPTPDEIGQPVQTPRDRERAATAVLERAAAQGRGEVPPQAQQNQSPEIPPDMEVITVRTERGTAQVLWPKTDQGKLEYLQSVLLRVEQTREENGGMTVSSILHEASTVLSTLLANPDKTEIASKLQAEFNARLKFHNAFLRFAGSNDIKEIQGAVSGVEASDLNTLFRKPEFIKALNYYEQHAEEYLKLSNTEKPAFREKVKLELARMPERGSEINIESAQILAERFWQFSGRMVIHDRLVPKLTDKEKAEGVTPESLSPADIEAKRQSGDVDWMGKDISGGNFAMRRLLKFDNWLDTQVKNINPFRQLMTGIDLGQRDYFSNIFEIPAENRLNPMDFEATNWKDFDFNKFGTNPMGFWAYLRLASPEGVRDALVKDTSALLRNPTGEAVVGLKDVFSYMGGDAWETKQRLLINVLEFLEHDNSRELRRGNINFEQKDKIIFDALKANYIRNQDLGKVETEALGRGRHLKRFGYIFSIWQFIAGVVSKFIETVAKGK